jgi:hypothetical protein
MDDSTVHRAGLYAWVPSSAGPNYFRVAEPVRAYTELGGRAAIGPMLDNEILNRCDTVLAHTIHDERNSEAWQELVRGQSHRLVLDIDDLMWDADWAPFRKHYTADTLDRLAANILGAHVVTTTTAYLAQRITDWTGHRNVHVLPNTVPAWLLSHDMPARDGQAIGWQGSPSHEHDFTSSLGTQLAKFLRDHPRWSVVFYGADMDFGHPRITSTPWLKSVEEYWRTVSVDVGIGPLRDTRFNRAKSALRAVEYAALGIVAVLPDVPTYRGWIDDGVTGLLVRSYQTVRGVLNELADSPAWLGLMAKNARTAAAGWTTEANIGQWVTAWNTA